MWSPWLKDNKIRTLGFERREPTVSTLSGKAIRLLFSTSSAPQKKYKKMTNGGTDDFSFKAHRVDAQWGSITGKQTSMAYIFPLLPFFRISTFLSLSGILAILLRTIGHFLAWKWFNLTVFSLFFFFFLPFSLITDKYEACQTSKI